MLVYLLNGSWYYPFQFLPSSRLHPAVKGIIQADPLYIEIHNGTQHSFVQTKINEISIISLTMVISYCGFSINGLIDFLGQKQMEEKVRIKHFEN